ncbi:hypothetical protein P775_25305 [Puniceibacterium antarcticum]|uniref:Uncharacterized protein n=1 Tax=Puniceibacterium antarcticum TaxID=1206336 RepID=A0A2G8R400_9RHOB|nr:hypothetical protein P775_25305 [Puniceibacterium antarcticum]
MTKQIQEISFFDFDLQKPSKAQNDIYRTN